MENVVLVDTIDGNEMRVTIRNLQAQVTYVEAKL